MGSGKADSSSSLPMDLSISEHRERHQQELDNLTVSSQPLRTLKFFVLAVVQYLKRSIFYLLERGGWLMLFSVVIVAVGALLMAIEAVHEQHMEELVQYLRFVLWWVTLGVASSIGLGSGLHTFVLYLGPHIAFFTIKAMQCGRVDLKSAPYDTIQLKRGPSWLDKDCSEFGPPLFKSLHGSRVPLSSILPQVQIEAILWGLGTALGELPPYFISRAANASGREMNVMEEFGASTKENSGVVATHLNHIKCWFLSHSQHLNFFTILILASVPNPLFDLAGIMCGQFGVPFWKFFLATLIGKAIIKTHIQTVFIISVCNNQLLHWIENELIWVFSHIPFVASVLPSLIAKVTEARDKYLTAQTPQPTDIQEKTNWGLSISSIWNTVVWLMLVNFSIKILNAAAQSYLKKQQEKELAALTETPPSEASDHPKNQ